MEFTEAELRSAIAGSSTWAETLRRIDYCPSGGNHATVRKYARLWAIPTDHFDSDRRQNAALRRKPRPLSEVLVRRSTYGRGHLKRRLYAEGLKQRRCELCGQGEEWRGGRLSLILDHINGVRDDHRLENLRIVCPNCAATLPTHCGRGFRKPRTPKDCPGCASQFVPASARQKYCSRECARARGRVSGEGVLKPGLRRVERPSYEQLMAEIEATSFSAVGRRYGVSDNAVRKWLRFYERQREREARDGSGADHRSGDPAEAA